MKKQIITLGFAVLVASSSAYGFGMKSGGCEKNSNNSHNKGILLKSDKSSNGIHSLMSVVSSLDLSRTQKSEIRKVMFNLKEENIKNMDGKKSFTITFNKDGKFNKQEFINNRTKLSKKMVNVQSKMIEKILTILDDEQKKIVQDNYHKR